MVIAAHKFRQTGDYLPLIILCIESKIDVSASKENVVVFRCVTLIHLHWRANTANLATTRR